MCIRDSDWSWPKVPRHKFLSEKKEAYDFDKNSLLIPLDISDVLSTPYPATIPSILARYIRLKKGDDISHNFIASGEIYYVLEGKGTTLNDEDVIEWSCGDVFCLPGGKKTKHRTLSENSILFCVTNEPILSFENLVPNVNGTNSIRYSRIKGNKSCFFIT